MYTTPADKLICFTHPIELHVVANGLSAQNKNDSAKMKTQNKTVSFGKSLSQIVSTKLASKIIGKE